MLLYEISIIGARIVGKKREDDTRETESAEPDAG